jgi:tetratricopeptide (TPR) repeat protein
VLGKTPRLLSLYGYTLALEKSPLERDKAIAACREAILLQPNSAENYLYFGKTLLIFGKTEQAIKMFRRGLKFDRHPEIIAQLKTLGLRKPVVFGSLSREHKLNKFCGLIFHHIGIR